MNIIVIIIVVVVILVLLLLITRLVQFNNSNSNSNNRSNFGVGEELPVNIVTIDLEKPFILKKNNRPLLINVRTIFTSNIDHDPPEIYLFYLKNGLLYFTFKSNGIIINKYINGNTVLLPYPSANSFSDEPPSVKWGLHKDGHIESIPPIMQYLFNDNSVNKHKVVSVSDINEAFSLVYTPNIFISKNDYNNIPYDERTRLLRYGNKMPSLSPVPPSPDENTPISPEESNSINISFLSTLIGYDIIYQFRINNAGTIVSLSNPAGSLPSSSTVFTLNNGLFTYDYIDSTGNKVTKNMYKSLFSSSSDFLPPYKWILTFSNNITKLVTDDDGGNHIIITDVSISKGTKFGFGKNYTLDGSFKIRKSDGSVLSFNNGVGSIPSTTDTFYLYNGYIYYIYVSNINVNQVKYILKDCTNSSTIPTYQIYYNSSTLKFIINETPTTTLKFGGSDCTYVTNRYPLLDDRYLTNTLGSSFRILKDNNALLTFDNYVSSAGTSPYRYLDPVETVNYVLVNGLIKCSYIDIPESTHITDNVTKYLLKDGTLSTTAPSYIWSLLNNDTFITNELPGNLLKVGSNICKRVSGDYIPMSNLPLSDIETTTSSGSFAITSVEASLGYALSRTNNSADCVPSVNYIWNLTNGLLTSTFIDKDDKLVTVYMYKSGLSSINPPYYKIYKNNSSSALLTDEAINNNVLVQVVSVSSIAYIHIGYYSTKYNSSSPFKLKKSTEYSGNPKTQNNLNFISITNPPGSIPAITTSFNLINGHMYYKYIDSTGNKVINYITSNGTSSTTQPDYFYTAIIVTDSGTTFTKFNVITSSSPVVDLKFNTTLVYKNDYSYPFSTTQINNTSYTDFVIGINNHCFKVYDPDNINLLTNYFNIKDGVISYTYESTSGSSITKYLSVDTSLNNSDTYLLIKSTNIPSYKIWLYSDLSGQFITDKITYWGNLRLLALEGFTKSYKKDVLTNYIPVNTFNIDPDKSFRLYYISGSNNIIFSITNPIESTPSTTNSFYLVNGLLTYSYIDSTGNKVTNYIKKDGTSITTPPSYSAVLSMSSYYIYYLQNNSNIINLITDESSVSSNYLTYSGNTLRVETHLNTLSPPNSTNNLITNNITGPFQLRLNNSNTNTLAYVTDTPNNINTFLFYLTDGVLSYTYTYSGITYTKYITTGFVTSDIKPIYYWYLLLEESGFNTFITDEASSSTLVNGSGTILLKEDSTFSPDPPEIGSLKDLLLIKFKLKEDIASSTIHSFYNGTGAKPEYSTDFTLNNGLISYKYLDSNGVSVTMYVDYDYTSGISSTTSTSSTTNEKWYLLSNGTFKTDKSLKILKPNSSSANFVKTDVNYIYTSLIPDIFSSLPNKVQFSTNNLVFTKYTIVNPSGSIPSSTQFFTFKNGIISHEYEYSGTIVTKYIHFSSTDYTLLENDYPPTSYSWWIKYDNVNDIGQYYIFPIGGADYNIVTVPSNKYLKNNTLNILRMYNPSYNRSNFKIRVGANDGAHLISHVDLPIIPNYEKGTIFTLVDGVLSRTFNKQKQYVGINYAILTSPPTDYKWIIEGVNLINNKTGVLLQKDSTDCTIINLGTEENPDSYLSPVDSLFDKTSWIRLYIIDNSGKNIYINLDGSTGVINTSDNIDTGKLSYIHSGGKLYTGSKYIDKDFYINTSSLAVKWYCDFERSYFFSSDDRTILRYGNGGPIVRYMFCCENYTNISCISSIVPGNASWMRDFIRSDVASDNNANFIKCLYNSIESRLLINNEGTVIYIPNNNSPGINYKLLTNIDYHKPQGYETLDTSLHYYKLIIDNNGFLLLAIYNKSGDTIKGFAGKYYELFRDVSILTRPPYKLYFYNGVLIAEDNSCVTNLGKNFIRMLNGRFFEDSGFNNKYRANFIQTNYIYTINLFIICRILYLHVDFTTALHEPGTTFYTNYINLLEDSNICGIDIADSVVTDTPNDYFTYDKTNTKIYIRTIIGDQISSSSEGLYPYEKLVNAHDNKFYDIAGIPLQITKVDGVNGLIVYIVSQYVDYLENNIEIGYIYYKTYNTISEIDNKMVSSSEIKFVWSHENEYVYKDNNKIDLAVITDNVLDNTYESYSNDSVTFDNINGYATAF